MELLNRLFVFVGIVLFLNGCSVKKKLVSSGESNLGFIEKSVLYDSVVSDSLNFVEDFLYEDFEEIEVVDRTVVNGDTVRFVTSKVKRKSAGNVRVVSDFVSRADVRVVKDSVASSFSDYVYSNTERKNGNGYVVILFCAVVCLIVFVIILFVIKIRRY